MVIKLLFYLTLWLVPLTGWANAQPLPVNQAFQTRIVVKDSNQLLIHFTVTKGYYLYYNRFRFAPDKIKPFRLAQPIMPPPNRFLSTSLGKFPVYDSNVSIGLPIAQLAGQHLILWVHYQGCSALGTCYPPQTQYFKINLATVNGVFYPQSTSRTPSQPPFNATQAYSTLMKDTSHFTVVLAFFLFGIVISLTPCVLPMVPIVSSIIVGKKPKGAISGFLLSMSYVLGMAVTYALAGLLFGWLGLNVQVYLQQTWVIILFSILFALLAWVMLSGRGFSLPHAWQVKLDHMSHKSSVGSYFGVFLTGCIATLVLSPCVTPPLAAALVYVGHSGNMLLGMLALFFMGLGMGVPLLLIGLGAGTYLPRSGPWLEGMTRLVGFILLALAIWMLAKVLPILITTWCIALYLLGLAVTLGYVKKPGHYSVLRTGLSALITLFALWIIVGIYAPKISPLPSLAGSNRLEHSVNIIHINSVSEFEQALTQSRGKPVVLDFYANWCIACKELDQGALSDARVIRALKNVVFMRVDLSSMNANHRTLMKKFNVIAPPTLIFFNRLHQRVQSADIVGNTAPATLMKSLQSTQ